MPKATTFDGKLVEYVEVHDEPIHRRQFSNEYVYVYIAGIRQVWMEVWSGARRLVPLLLAR